MIIPTVQKLSCWQTNKQTQTDTTENNKQIDTLSLRGW